MPPSVPLYKAHHQQFPHANSGHKELSFTASSNTWPMVPFTLLSPCYQEEAEAPRTEGLPLSI